MATGNTIKTKIFKSSYHGDLENMINNLLSGFGNKSELIDIKYTTEVTNMVPSGIVYTALVIYKP